jgi:hypothetical protein
VKLPDTWPRAAYRLLNEGDLPQGSPAVLSAGKRCRASMSHFPCARARFSKILGTSFDERVFKYRCNGGNGK